MDLPLPSLPPKAARPPARHPFGLLPFLAPALCWAALWLAAPSPAWGAGEILCVKAPRALLRSGPGLNQPVSRVVFRYTPLQLIDRRGEWLQVLDQDGNYQWIQAQQTAEKQKCAAVEEDYANLRDGAGVNAKKLYAAKRGAVYKVTGQEGDWLKLDQEGETLYIRADKTWPASK